MRGVAKNLTAKLASHYERLPDRDIDRQNAPLEDALALIVREKLTGAKPPRGANGIVEVWRPWIEDKAGSMLQRMEGAIDDQAAFGKLMRDVLVALELMEGSARKRAAGRQSRGGREGRCSRPRAPRKKKRTRPSQAKPKTKRRKAPKAIRKATPRKSWRKITRPASRKAKSSPMLRPGARIRPCSKPRRISAIRSSRGSMTSS